MASKRERVAASAALPLPPEPSPESTQAEGSQGPSRQPGDYPFTDDELDFMDRAAIALHKVGITPNKAYNEAHTLLLGRAAWLEAMRGYKRG